ncbi:MULTISPECIES: DNA-3-methyladenine glycosylase family protein [Aestuariimicrobium]|uniref:DNA-3-methyladenine glycosylase family protein n=1 Tax=Aestuariimicrobium TaxID=396388 RepID=UPI0003B6D571|nr:MULTISPECIES: 3-methyladenine DNA glycosylase [Aestuariimicrobium]
MQRKGPVGRVVPGLAPCLDSNLARHQRGHGDPTHRHRHGTWWRASTTPEGPALTEFTARGEDVDVRAWGPGAGWALASAPRLLGSDDRLDVIAEDHPLRTHPVVGPLARAHLQPIGRSELVAESLAPTVIEQKVTGAEAFAALRTLIRQYGTAVTWVDQGHPAAGMVCPPSAEQWVAIPSWAFVLAGVDPRRARTLVAALARVPALQRILDRQGYDDAVAAGEALAVALQSLPGIGPWTAARVRQAAVGDPDAWSVDDYHVPGAISHALTGTRSSLEPGDSRHATVLLVPFRGHRYRVELLLARAPRAERRGPRRSLPTHLPTRSW